MPDAYGSPDVESALRRTAGPAEAGRHSSAFEARLRQRLDELDARGLRRSLRSPSGIDLSSNDYLALSNHPAVVARFMAGAARDGCGSTGSRLLRGERDSFSAIERRFATFKRTERALYFSSGYMANLAVLTTFVEAGDTVYSDAFNHASLIDGIRLSRGRAVVFTHNDVADLERALLEIRESGERVGQRGLSFVVVESLFSMDGDEAPLSAYAELCRRYGAVLVVDEAHAVGVFGARGSGLVEECDLDANACLTISTAGKALGVSGAFAAGPAWAIEYLMQRARPFVFSTAPPPPVADAIDASLTIVEREPERRARVLALSSHLRQRLAHESIAVLRGRSQIIPVVVGHNDRASAAAAIVQHAGFDVRAIRPPSVPPGTSRLRVSVNAGLSEATLDRFADHLTSALREVGLCSAVSS